jgi:hypothetical protein
MSDRFQIDYKLRPAKTIVRKMVVDVMRRLSHIHPIQSYQYIGFGSYYFRDFKLIHRELGISNMTSIEGEINEEGRVRFNNPYDCINIKIGQSTDILDTEMDLNRPTILWLDYTTELKPYMFEDIDEFCFSAPPGSMLFITLNVETMDAKTLNESNYSDREEKLIEDLRKENVPKSALSHDLRDRWGLAEAYRDIILEKIKTDFLEPRNDRLDNDIQFEQLTNFRYKDTQKMMTLGGILRSNEIIQQYKRASFEDLEVVRTDEEPLIINPPSLTVAEMKEIERKLPSSPLQSEVEITDDEIRRYSEVYKYFPRFVESEL